MGITRREQSTREPGGAGRGGQVAVTLDAFSVMKEVMEKAVIPGFNAKWRREHGTEARFTSSYAGSETITNQILQGVGAYERLTVRLDLVVRRPQEGEPPLYSVTVNTPEKRLGVPVFVTRPKPEANAAPLEVGDRGAVGLTSFRVLPNFARASERGGKIVDTEKQ